MSDTELRLIDAQIFKITESDNQIKEWLNDINRYD